MASRVKARVDRVHTNEGGRCAASERPGAVWEVKTYSS